MLTELVCKVLHHRIDRNRVWNDGIDYRTNCARCGAALLRGHHRWREFDMERDARQDREAHPRHRQASS